MARHNVLYAKGVRADNGGNGPADYQRMYGGIHSSRRGSPQQSTCDDSLEQRCTPATDTGRPVLFSRDGKSSADGTGADYRTDTRRIGSGKTTRPCRWPKTPNDRRQGRSG